MTLVICPPNCSVVLSHPLLAQDDLVLNLGHEKLGGVVLIMETKSESGGGVHLLRSPIRETKDSRLRWLAFQLQLLG